MKISHNLKLQFLLPLTLMLLLAMLLVYVNIARLDDAHHEATLVQNNDLEAITQATNFSQMLGEVQQRMNATLQSVHSGQLHREQLPKLHSNILDALNELSSTVTQLSLSPAVAQANQNNMQDLLKTFDDYQRLVIMTIEALASDADDATDLLRQAQQHYVASSILSSRIELHLAARALAVNKHHVTDFELLVQRMLLTSLVALALIFAIALYASHRAGSNMLDIADALRKLAKNPEAPKDLPRIKYLYEHSDGELKQITGKLLELGHALQRQQEAEKKAFQLAFYDPLTNLPNRYLLDERVQQAIGESRRHSRTSALLVLDLDAFKQINSSLGHNAGDMLLIEAGDRLSETAQKTDTVARINGNTFAILLPALHQSREKAASLALQLAERLLEKINEPIFLNEEPVLTSACCGITLFDVTTDDFRLPIKQAEAAMYHAKSKGRGRIRFFDSDLQQQQDLQSSLENDLRWAVELGQLVLFYQLQVNADDKPQGVEALLRWQHPERGLVPPNDFIPLAESSDLILPIGDWVLQSACQQLRRWQQQAGFAELSIAVNVSVRQFHQSDFVTRVKQLLCESGAPAKRLKLEITESLVVEEIISTVDKMRELRSLGVCLSLDDFGTGYSSLQYLQRMPLDQLKIEQSFARGVVNDQGTAAIVQAIIAMGDALSIEVIAEGVETPEQKEFFYQQGCKLYQGYLFSKPVPLTEVEKLVSQWQPADK